jgi:iron complex transport system substrate-binding protein
MSKILGCDVYEYNPITLEGILAHIDALGKKFQKVNIAEALITSLRSEITGSLSETSSPSVFYEVSQLPFMAAGSKSIIKDIVERAGGRFLVQEDRKVFKLGLESVLIMNPDIYLYQIGPMNKKPVEPQKRNEYKNLSSRFIKVNETDFSRANTKSFRNVEMLNKLFANH